MSLFDLGAGLVLIVSALIGWIRGATREVATVLALVAAAVLSLVALRYSGPVARHAIHTPWLANIAAILMVFAAVYILLRVAASAMTRRIQQTSGLGGVDRTVGAGIGVARALVVLGLANLTINAIVPAERMPAWISGAFLYPVSTASAAALRAFAPQGAALAKQAFPVVGHAIQASDAATNAPDQNRGYNAASDDAPGLRVEKTP
jgi:membrane protein required for colicin V production